MSATEEDEVTREVEKQLDRQREAEAKKAKATAQPSFFKDLTREKSVTKKVGEDYVKITYGLGVNLTAIESQTIEDVEKARAYMKNFTDRWIDEDISECVILKKPKETAMPQEPISLNGVPKIDPAELDECEWLTFGHPRQPARPGTAAGIKNPTYFTDFEAPPALLELTKALAKVKDHRVVIGDMEYSLGGKDEMKDHFINRKPVKIEGAR